MFSQHPDCMLLKTTESFPMLYLGVVHLKKKVLHGWRLQVVPISFVLHANQQPFNFQGCQSLFCCFFWSQHYSSCPCQETHATLFLSKPKVIYNLPSTSVVKNKFYCVTILFDGMRNKEKMLAHFMNSVYHGLNCCMPSFAFDTNPGVHKAVNTKFY